MTWKKKIAGTAAMFILGFIFIFTGIVDRYEFN